MIAQIVSSSEDHLVKKKSPASKAAGIAMVTDSLIIWRHNCYPFPREEWSTAIRADSPYRNCAVFIPLKLRLFPFCPRWKALSLPPPPSLLSLSPSFSLSSECRFIFGGRVLDINCPASIVIGKHTVQLAQIPLVTTIQWRTTGPSINIWFKSRTLGWR